MSIPAGGRIGLGVAFQPVPGAQIVRPEHGDGIARIPSHPGTPVHAVVAGLVLDVDGAGGLALRGPDGSTYRYAGLEPGSVTVAAGVPVAAGDILGAVGGTALALRLVDADGDPLDAVEALLGLTDPNELGYAPTGAGLGIDPDELDRQVLRDGLPGPGRSIG